MSRADWKCVGQIGDANPVGEGGCWVFVDRTGQYDPRCEVWDPDIRKVWQFTICQELEEWVNLEGISSVSGTPRSVLTQMFSSEDPLVRAEIWCLVGRYHGFLNLDGYPLSLLDHEAEERYSRPEYAVQEDQGSSEVMFYVPASLLVRVRDYLWTIMQERSEWGDGISTYEPSLSAADTDTLYSDVRGLMEAGETKKES